MDANGRELHVLQSGVLYVADLYNHERPHQAIGLKTPDTRYRVSPRAFPEHLPQVEYGGDDLVRKADPSGMISFKGRYFRIGKAFCGQLVALRPADEDGAFSVHFCAQQIGAINLHADHPGLWTCGQREAALPTGSTGQQQQQG
jgi:hypothetical protein